MQLNFKILTIKKNINYSAVKYIFLIFPILFLTRCSNKQEKIKPVLKDISESVYASGIIVSSNQYQVYSNVSGTIEQLMVDEGDSVITGQPIIKINNLTSEISEENAKLASKNADYQNNIEKLNELEINSNLAKSKFHIDSLLFVRQKNLWSQQIGSLNDLEQKELSYKNSKTLYEISLIKLVELKKLLKFTDEQFKNNLRFSNSVNKEYTIKSLKNGIVYNIFRKKGEMISSQNPIAIIGDENNFKIELQVDEYDIIKVNPGQYASIILDSYGNTTYEAKIVKINPFMNERSRTFLVEAEFIKQPKILYPNLTVEANIVIQLKKNALIIPRNYIIDDKYILLQNNIKKEIKIGLKDYLNVEVLKGLTINDIILKPKN